MGSLKKSWKLLSCATVIFGIVTCASSRPSASDLNRDHESGKPWEQDLSKADAAFDSARSAYVKGDIGKGDEQLESMMAALNSCVESLGSVHKARFYKKAELRVAYLQRRMKALLDDIEVTSRGWAEQTDRKLEEVHEKLIAGVMQK